jgi:hypothetical protein
MSDDWKKVFKADPTDWLLVVRVGPYRNRMWLNYGSRGKPSQWVTLRALRVIK